MAKKRAPKGRLPLLMPDESDTIKIEMGIENTNPRTHQRIRTGIISMHALGVLALASPLAGKIVQTTQAELTSFSFGESAEDLLERATTTRQERILPTVLNFTDRRLFEGTDSRIERARVASLLIPSNRAADGTSVEHALETIDRVRNDVGNLHLYSGRTILYFAGSENIPDTTDPQFDNPAVIGRVQSIVGRVNVHRVSGRTESPVHGERATRESLTNARKQILDYIAGIRTPIHAIVNAHGSELFIQVGTWRPAESARPHIVVITAQEFTDALIARYRDPELRAQARRIPDILTLHSCGSGNLAELLARTFEERRNETDTEFPVTISSTEGVESSYGNQAVRLTLPFGHSARVRTFFDGRSVGTEEHGSNPAVRALDRRTGRIIEIA
jgi:hypothetical protein